jgi:hypothetical protein
LPALTSEYPGLLPWHFGGDERLTYAEILAYQRDFDDRVKARKKQNDDLKRSQSTARARARRR